MQKPGCHPEGMLESKHTEPNKQQSQRLWERPNTQLPRGTPSWNLPERESSSAWPSNTALSAANPTVTELLTVLLPGPWSQTVDSLSTAVPSDAQESQQLLAGFVMREGGRKLFGFLSQECSVQCLLQKKGKTFALEFSPKCKFKRFLDISVPCSSALPLTVTYFNRQLYKYVWQPKNWMSWCLMKLLQESSPGLPKINNFEQLL